MEYAQLESRISFLDSEYRKEKAELAQVRQKLETTTAEKKELTHRVETLETELDNFRSQLSKVSLLESMMERFKGEMMGALDDRQAQQKRMLKDAERSRTIELESYVKSIADVRHELERQRSLDELISLARTETDRQASVQVSFQQRLDTIAKQNDDQLRSISYLEEQHRTGAKHITELSAETSDLFKQTKLHLSKIELLEREIPQFGQFQNALSKVQERVAAESERLQYQQAQIDRTVKTWNENREEWQRRLDEYETRMERYAEHYQRNLKALEALQTFQEHLQRTQHEFVELQRLNNDRQKGQLETWQSEQEQFLRQATLETDRALSESRRRVDRLTASLKEAADALSNLQKQNTQLLKIIEEDAMSRAIAARDWQVRFEDLTAGEE